MAQLILDTTILVEAERADRRLDELVGDADDVVIAAVTAAELLVGVELSDDRRRPGAVRASMRFSRRFRWKSTASRSRASTLACSPTSGEPGTRVAHTI